MSVGLLKASRRGNFFDLQTTPKWAALPPAEADALLDRRAKVRMLVGKEATMAQ
jgi:hypothetical protein